MYTEEIRYHPLVDMDTDRNEKMPMFQTTNGDLVKKVHSLYLSEMITNYFRLHSKKPLSRNESNSMIIHCPRCGSIMKRITNNDADKLGIYTCNKCK